MIKDIIFNPPKDLSKTYVKAENFIAIDDVIEVLSQNGLINLGIGIRIMIPGQIHR